MVQFKTTTVQFWGDTSALGLARDFDSLVSQILSSLGSFPARFLSSYNYCINNVTRCCDAFERAGERAIKLVQCLADLSYRSSIRLERYCMRSVVWLLLTSKEQIPKICTASTPPSPPKPTNEDVILDCMEEETILQSVWFCWRDSTGLVLCLQIFKQVSE